MPRPRPIRPLLTRLAAARDGVAAVEFALIAPILILVFIGMADVAQGYMAQRRAVHIASTIADLTAQSQSVSTANLNDYFNIGALVLAPFPTAGLSQRITSITADSKGVPHVDWSQPTGSMTGLTDSTVTVPANLLAPGQSIIEADVSYTYANKIAWVLPTAMTFKQSAYLKPRQSLQVTHTN
jgi:Flp pilus assembly protein TadG